MKKIISLTLACVMIVALMFTMVSCAKTISGSYQGELNVVLAKYTVTYNFDGNKVEVVHKVSSILGNAEPTTVEGTYEIAEDEAGDLTITFTFPQENEDEVAKSATYDFEEGENYIKIGGVQYTKVEK